MFWSGNFIVVRELNFLLKEENVTLSQVLEAEDLLQECKADNKALMQFLTRPDILAELITLITEEPPKNVEVAQQYRHASIACEVLTSPLSMLSDRLSLDTAQMNRLCDFINRDPPLNPLLASYFSKTVEMLLERSLKQDWYLYHIVCLRVLDFFKSRRDFLPNLLRHISTSAIADTFKYFIRLDDLFNKFIMEWLEEHQIIECLIQIICGTYVSEELSSGPEEPEKGQLEPSEKEDVNHKEEEGSQDDQNNTEVASPPDLIDRLPEPRLTEQERKVQIARTAAVASANAATLLCELVATGCAVEGAATRSRTSWVLLSRLQSEGGVSALLQGMFTSQGAARRHAVVNGTRLLLTLLNTHAVLGAEGPMERSNVELAVAPHLPLLHQALLHDPQRYAQEEEGDSAGRGQAQGEGRGEGEGEAVGAARVMTATLLAHLALSEVEEVSTTLLTLGTPGVLVDMFFRYPNNNFLHAAVHLMVRHALANTPYRTQYKRHLLVECDLLTRLMDAFEENENKQSGAARCGYMGHVALTLSCVSAALEAEGAGQGAGAEPLPPAVCARWDAFRDNTLFPLMQQYATPLGQSYPSENIYEDSLTDTMAANYDYSYAMAAATMDEVGDELPNDNEMLDHPGGLADSAEFIADGLGVDEDHKMNSSAKSNFLELARQRFGDDMWDDLPEGEEGEEGEEAQGEGEEGPAPPEAVREVLGEGSPWEVASPSSPGGSGWAQFEGLTAAPADPFADNFSQGFSNYWPYEGDQSAELSCVEGGLRGLHLADGKALSDARTVSLANNLLTAMSAMTPDAIANIVNANLDPLDACHLPALSKDSPATTEGLPAQTTGSPATTEGVPVDTTGLSVKTEGLPAVNSLPDGADTADVPSASVQSSSHLDAKENLPSEDSPSSPRISETKHLNDTRSEPAGKVTDIASAATEQGSNSPGSVTENTDKVLEVAEAPIEVSDTSER